MSSRMPGLARLGATLFAASLAACAGAQSSGGAGLASIGSYQLAAAPASDPISAYGDFLAGNFARDTGQVDEAAAYFESALAGNPDNHELLASLFELTLASGDFEQAKRRAAQLVEVDPEADEAVLLLALEAVRQGDFVAAQKQVGAIGERGIAALAAPFVDAWAIFGAGAEGAVEPAVVRLEQGEPLGPLNDYHKAMLLYLAGRPRAGLEALEGAMPQGDRVPTRMAEAYAAMLTGSGQRARAVTFLREQLAAAVEQPHLERALAALERQSEPKLPFDEAAGGIADALLGIAEALHQERGGQRAVSYARMAEFVQPELDDAALLIGDIMAEQENFDAAIRAYRAVEDSSPMSEAAQLRTARALYQLERDDAAYEVLEELADAHPTRVDALVQLGDLLRREEQYDAAEDAYSRAIERLGKVEPAHWSLFYTRGIAYERTERWPEAEADFLKALELEPEQPFVLNYLGYSWVDMGMHLDRAKGMLNRAVELRPDDGFIVDSLGWVHYRLGEYPDAVESLERAVELEPADPVINDHLGDAYWRVGRQREARYQWQRALTLEPEPDVEAAIRKKLKSGLPDQDGTEIDRT